MASSYSAALQVTIALLPEALSLAHIPRSRLPSLFHPIIRQLLNPRPAFLNLTCNEIELSIFAESEALKDFELIARRDRQRQRSRSGSTSSPSRADTFAEGAIEVSYDQWRVLQIDSHSDHENTGTRVQEISAPLAAAGISILYQSSHISDFIFVKSSRLQEVLSIFSSAGFDVLSSETDTMSPFQGDPVPCNGNLDGTVMTRQRSSTASSAGAYSGLSAPPLDDLTEEAETSPTRRPPLTRTSTLSPAPTDVRVLNPDLSCIGLTEDAADVWTLRLVKLVAYPELIVCEDANASSMEPTRRMTSQSPPTSPVAPQKALNGDSAVLSDEEGEEDGYYSASPRSRSPSGSPAASRSQSLECLGDRRSGKYSHLHRIATATELARMRRNPPPSASFSRTSHAYPVPFFSITRTDEGTSLTAPIATLAALFPASDRYMVIRGNDLDEFDASGGLDWDGEEGEEDHRDGPMRCLQIDLRQFGLDKYGLVNMYSRVLEENGINHMYSSTFKTANLLVGRHQAIKAQTLLREL